MSFKNTPFWKCLFEMKWFIIFKLLLHPKIEGGGRGWGQLKLENKKQEIKLQKDYNVIHDLNYYAQTKTCPSSFKNIHQGEKSLWWYFIHHCKGSYFWQAIWNKILSFMKAEILLKPKNKELISSPRVSHSQAQTILHFFISRNFLHLELFFFLMWSLKMDWICLLEFRLFKHAQFSF